MEAIGDGETFFLSTWCLKMGRALLTKKRVVIPRARLSLSHLKKNTRDGWLDRRTKGSDKAGLTVLVLRRSTACGRRGIAGWPKEIAKTSKKKKMPGRKG